jgi:hypothetical protein
MKGFDYSRWISNHDCIGSDGFENYRPHANYGALANNHRLITSTLNEHGACANVGEIAYVHIPVATYPRSEGYIISNYAIVHHGGIDIALKALANFSV